MTEIPNEYQPKKGPFWLICDIDLVGNISPDKILSFSVELSQITPSHKDIWDSCRGNIKKPWNYYPRGRVEVKKDKAIVYANSLCFEYADLSKQLRIAYNLGDLPLELKADNSAHYTKGVCEPEKWD